MRNIRNIITSLILLTASCLTSNVYSQVTSNPAGNVSNVSGTSGWCYVTATPTWDIAVNSKNCRAAYNSVTGEFWMWETTKLGNGAWVLKAMVTKVSGTGTPAYTPTNPNEIAINGAGQVFAWDGSAWISTNDEATTFTASTTISNSGILPNLNPIVVAASLDSTHYKQGGVSYGDLSPATQDSMRYSVNNGLKKINNLISFGSNSSTVDDSKLLYNTFIHLDGKNLSFLGALGAPNDVEVLYPNGRVYMGSDSGSVVNKYTFAFLKDKQAIYIGRPLLQSEVSEMGLYSGVFSGLNSKPPAAYSGSFCGQELNASGPWSACLAGFLCTASGVASVTSGGYTNMASGDYSGVFTGRLNTASGVHSVVNGGRVNNATASESTVGGGDTNTASAEGATVPGGQLNTASGENSFATNIGANATSSSSVAMGSFPVIATSQTVSQASQVPTDILESLGNSPATALRSNARTTQKNGSVQFVHKNAPSSMTELDATPITAFEFTSTQKGLVLPRLTAAQVATWQGTFNLTTDQTGLSGAGDEYHSRRGEIVYNTTTGCINQANWNGSAWVFSSLCAGESLPIQSVLNTFTGVTSSNAVSAAVFAGFTIGSWIYWDTGTGAGITPLKIN